MKSTPLSVQLRVARAARSCPGPDHGREARATVLSPGEIHVWRAHLDAPPPAAIASLRALLSADELERAQKFYFERDRRRFVVGRGILRKLLGAYLAIEPAQVAFRYGANGKPALAASARDASHRGMPSVESPSAHTSPAAVSLFFNLAHSEDLAVYAFTRAGEIGIDVERIRDMPDWPSIAEMSFSPEELTRLHACPPVRRREEFFHAWTRQEAVLKAAGTGLPGARAVCPPSPDAAGELAAFPDFHVLPLAVAPGFAAALAVQRPCPITHFS